MKHLILILLLTGSLYSQSISKQIIGTSGKTQSDSNLKVSWTVGESIVGLMTGGGNQLSNGYYPALNMKALSIEDNSLVLQVKLYPNPSSQILYVSHPELTSFTIHIVDLYGKQIFSGNINRNEPFDISTYTQGFYLVTVENKDINKKNTYKIIKK